MIVLTDQQLSTVMQAAKSLPPPKRDIFLQRIAATLRRSERFTDSDVEVACCAALRGLVHEAAT